MLEYWKPLLGMLLVFGLVQQATMRAAAVGRADALAVQADTLVAEAAVLAARNAGLQSTADSLETAAADQARADSIQLARLRGQVQASRTEVVRLRQADVAAAERVAGLSEELRASLDAEGIQGLDLLTVAYEVQLATRDSIIDQQEVTIEAQAEQVATWQAQVIMERATAQALRAANSGLVEELDTVKELANVRERETEALRQALRPNLFGRLRTAMFPALAGAAVGYVLASR